MILSVLEKILKHLEDVGNPELTEYFLYDVDIKELNLLSSHLDLFHNNDQSDYLTEDEEELFYTLILKIAALKNPLIFELKYEELQQTLVEEIKYFITTASVCNLAKIGLIKFDDTHLHPSKWKISSL